MSQVIEDWLQDRVRTDHYSNRRFYEIALEHGVTDRRVVANAIALVQTAQHLHLGDPSVPFDSYVNGLLQGLYPDAEFHRWSLSMAQRVRLWWSVTRDDIYWFQRRLIRRIRG